LPESESAEESLGSLGCGGVNQIENIQSKISFLLGIVDVRRRVEMVEPKHKLLFLLIGQHLLRLVAGVEVV
jgi:hypothetical protein